MLHCYQGTVLVFSVRNIFVIDGYDRSYFRHCTILSYAFIKRECNLFFMYLKEMLIFHKRNVHENRIA
jgi:hypothetical protein